MSCARRERCAHRAAGGEQRQHDDRNGDQHIGRQLRAGHDHHRDRADEHEEIAQRDRGRGAERRLQLRGVGGQARDDLAGLFGVEEARVEPGQMGEEVAAQIGDDPLAERHDEVVARRPRPARAPPRRRSWRGNRRGSGRRWRRRSRSRSSGAPRAARPASRPRRRSARPARASDRGRDGRAHRAGAAAGRRAGRGAASPGVGGGRHGHGEAPSFARALRTTFQPKSRRRACGAIASPARRGAIGPPAERAAGPPGGSSLCCARGPRR